MAASQDFDAAWAAWDAMEAECEANPAPGKQKRRRSSAGSAAKPVKVARSAGSVAAQADAPAPAKCISMHQPWASLLVAGIKTLEGWSWATKHRGKLYISSTTKKCDKTSLARFRSEWEQRRASLAGSLLPDWPAEFPPARLLGTVEVLDCMLNTNDRIV